CGKICSEGRSAASDPASPPTRISIAAVENAVFSFIPNTAESAYMGLIEEIERLTRRQREHDLWQAIESGAASRDEVARLLNGRLRTEKIAHKDQRLRTFITHDAARRDLVLHIYDIT